jgi:hypothetical protein
MEKRKTFPLPKQDMDVKTFHNVVLICISLIAMMFRILPYVYFVPLCPFR